MYNMHLNAHCALFKSHAMMLLFLAVVKTLLEQYNRQHAYCIARYVLFVLFICGCVKPNVNKRFNTFIEVDQLMHIFLSEQRKLLV